MRVNTIAMLSGDVRKVEALIRQNNNQPLPIAINDWEVPVSVNSFLFAYVLYDGLRYDDDQELFASRHIQELLDLHMQICSVASRPDYGKLPFITGNIDVYFDEDDTKFLLNDGVSQKDIDLTNYGIRHIEDEVIRLLKEGASPYFLNRTDFYDRKENVHHYVYFDVAPMLSVLKDRMLDQWDYHGLGNFKEDVKTLSKESLERLVFCMFQAAASNRILYLVDQYIMPEVRKRGFELMKKYNIG